MSIIFLLLWYNANNDNAKSTSICLELCEIKRALGIFYNDKTRQIQWDIVLLLYIWRGTHGHGSYTIYGTVIETVIVCN